MNSVIRRLYCAECGIGFNNEAGIAIVREHATSVYSFVCTLCADEKGK